MQIFLTGAQRAGQTSTPAQSLGGYISITGVQNAVLGNVFGLVSQYAKQLNRPEYRIIAIHNDSTSTLTNLKAYFGYDEDDSDSGTIDEVEAMFSVGYQTPSVDNCGELYTQSLATPNQAPYSVTFSEALGEDEALALPDLAADGYLIIFLRRILDPVQLTDEELAEITAGDVILNTEENVYLTFSWD